MTNSTTCLRGSQEPTRSVIPPYLHNELERCLSVNEAGGLVPYEWQINVLRSWLGCTYDADGCVASWTSRKGGLSVARQNGKSLGVIGARINYGLFSLGEEIIYTAHLQKTATETWEGIASFFDQPRFRKYVKAIKTAIGRETVELKNGGRVKFLARTRNGGRGQHGSLLIFDESQCLDDNQQASFVPAVSAQAHPQTLYVGTPPDENAYGEVFRRQRANALGGIDGSISWMEWGVDSMPRNLADRALWAATNPSLGIRIGEDVVMDELTSMSAETFAVERLGLWLSSSQDMLFDMDAWDSMAVTDAPPTGVVAIGVKFSADGSRVSLAIAMKQPDGRVYLELVENRNARGCMNDIGTLICNMEPITSCVIVDGRCGAQNLVNEITKEGGISKRAVSVASTQDAVNANTLFSEWFAQGKLMHFDQEQLNNAVRDALRRNIGTNGGWGFRGYNDTDVTPLEASALALWGVYTTKRDPSRKTWIG